METGNTSSAAIEEIDQTGQNLSSDAAINFIHSLSQPEKVQTAVI